VKGGYEMVKLYYELNDIGLGINKMQAYLNMFQDRGLIQTRNLQDGVFGPRTQQATKEWQQYKGLPITGTIDTSTWASIVDELRELKIISNVPAAVDSYYFSQGNQSLGVYQMQMYLNEIAAKNPCLRPIPVDGIYGPRTTMAVQQFQYLYDLTIDGVIGAQTFDAIVNTRNMQ
jgi:murein L,D-transpeptidase YcbB/YkuD